VAIETTPLGFQKPDGNEPFRQGNDVISANAQKTQDLIAAAKARLALLEQSAGFPGDPVELADDVVQVLVTDPISTTAVALNAAYGRTVLPSGLTAGTADAAAINAALLLGDVTLRGTYYTNAPIRVPSNRVLTLHEADVNLIPGSNCNVVQNYHQNATGNENITLQGIGRAIINGGNSTTQTSASAYNSIGVTWTHVTNLTVRNVKIGPCRGPVMVLQGVINGKISGIEVAQDRTGNNQDGIDIGAACDGVDIRDITGITGDDAFSLFSQKTAGFAHSLYKAATGVPGTKNVTISNVSLNVGINPVRLQAGDGLTLTGVRISNFRNTNPATSLYAVLMFGSVAYVTTPPSMGDMTDITLSGYHGPGNVIIGAGSNFSYVSVSDVTLTGPWKTFIGTEQSGTNYAATTEHISFDNITASDATGTPTVVNTPSGQSHSAMTLTNLKLRRIGNLLNNAGTISGLFINGVHIRSITGQLIRSSAVETGQIDNVFIQGSSSSAYYLVNAARLRFGPSMPFVRSGDITPDATTKGSIITCAAGKDPTGASSATGGQYVANGATWVKTADLGTTF